MAGKSPRGLPPSFNLDIPSPDTPVELGDYLDEVDAARPVVVKPAPAPREEPSPKVVEMRRPAAPPVEVPPTPAPSETAEPEARALAPRRRKKIKGPARKQINTTPDAMRMIDEIIDHVQTYSPQKDAKGSEVFHALVLALHESLEHLELSDIPHRGRWGTPTAKAFSIHLKNAFQDAIAAAARKARR